MSRGATKMVPTQSQEAGGFEEALLKLMSRVRGISRYDGALLEDAVRAAHRTEVAGYKRAFEASEQHVKFLYEQRAYERAAGVAEGRRSMAREGAAYFRSQFGNSKERSAILQLCAEWLESEAGEEKKP